ncbi:hypothetical protein MADA3029_60066 [Vibrio nigripulchritudo MADA3029]|nr:hypothetical protein VIBNIMADA3020_290068 [Vibrio nigripulchritudo MADA3020]CCN50965.1 hypothetical protein VIBNIMADA3021_10068 [Vibrio nigripulchritudo MADA3021]CCN60483.1 hypothetical protein MADA3029_60066 [Vibrio nigripulchritudo MADA3029]
MRFSETRIANFLFFDISVFLRDFGKGIQPSLGKRGIIPKARNFARNFYTRAAV